jgi:hypothetical protein
MPSMWLGGGERSAIDEVVSQAADEPAHEISLHGLHVGPGTDPGRPYPPFLARSVVPVSGPGLAWDATYGEIGTWGKTPSGVVIKIIGMQPTPSTEALLNQWYVERHIPQELDFPGVLGAARYRRVTDDPVSDGFGLPYPRYLAMYFYDDLAAAEAWEASPQRAAAYADVTAFLERTGVTRLWRVRYVPLDVAARPIG